MLRVGRMLLLLGVLATSSALAGKPAPEPIFPMNIAAQPLATAVDEFTLQTGTSVLVTAEHSDSIQVNPVSGDLTRQEALKKLLERTGVVYTWVSPNVVSLRVPKPRHSIPRSEPPPPRGDIPQISIAGSRDRKQISDDFRPGRELDRGTLASAAVSDLSDALSDPMTSGFGSESPGEMGSVAGNQKELNLAGMGPTDTLVLLNGRRLPKRWMGGAPMQPDLAGIPVAAISKVEIVSGITSSVYGGGAVGTVNVVSDSEFEGFQVDGAVGRANGTAADALSASLKYGGRFFEDSTRVSLNLGMSKFDPLLMSDLDGFESARWRILENNADFWYRRNSPPLAKSPNVKSVTADDLGNGLGAFVHLPAGYRSGGSSLNAVRGYDFAAADTAANRGGGRAPLRPGIESAFFLAQADHQVSDRHSLFVELMGTSLHRRTPTSAIGYLGLEGALVLADAPTNPFGRPVRVTRAVEGADGILDEHNAAWRSTFGGTWELNEAWSLKAEYIRAASLMRWTQPAARSAAEDAAVGVLDLFQDPALGPLDVSRYMYTLGTSWLPSRSKSWMLQAVGHLFDGSAGNAAVSLAVTRQRESYGDGTQWRESGSQPRSELNRFPRQYQDMWGALAELNASYNRWDFQLAGRWERTEMRVSTFMASAADGADFNVETPKFDTLSPMAATRWHLTDELSLRGSVARGYVMPTVTQLTPAAWYSIEPAMFIDSQRGGELVVDGAVGFGGNPALRPEQVNSVSAGIQYSPRWVSGTHLSIDRTRLRKRGDITSLADLDLALVEELDSTRVVRGEPLPGDPWAVGPVTRIDLSDSNLSRVEAVQWEAKINGATSTYSWGKLDWRMRATWQPVLLRQLTERSPEVNEAGVTSQSPLLFSAAGRVLWSYRPWRLGWATRHASAYEVSRNQTIALNQGRLRVPGQTYHDVQIGWSPQFPDRWLRSFDVQFSVANVFGREPPFDAAAARNGYYSPYGDPRVRYGQLMFSVTF